MKKQMMILLSGLVSVSIWAQETPSLEVTTLADVVDANDGYISLREAIAYSAADPELGKTITFHESLWGERIVLALGQLEITNSVHIVGPGQDLLTIDANGKSRIFRVVGEDTDVHIEGLTVTGGGNVDKGGGIYNRSGSLTLREVTVINNLAGDSEYDYAYGGGVFNDSGELKLINCEVSDNSVLAWRGTYGGGIYNNTGMLTTTNVACSGNQARNGGGIFIQSGNSILRDMLICSNAASSGGGIFNNSGVLTLNASTVKNNSGSSSGGGVFNNSGTMTLVDVEVSGNSLEGAENRVVYAGAGIMNASGTLRMEKVIVSSNTIFLLGGSDPSARGGGVFCGGGSLEMIHVLINDNSLGVTDGHIIRPSVRCGGLHVGSQGVLNLTHVTISGNSAEGLYVDSGGNVTLNNTIVARNEGDNVSGGYTGSSNFIGGDPWFVNFENGDYRLRAGSLAIDAGDNELALDADGNSLERDLDGKTRKFNGTVDVGAYEYVPVVSLSISGEDIVSEGSIATYFCRATFEDGSTSRVPVSWSLDSTVAQIDANGVLSAGFVDHSQTITVMAEYDGIMETFDVMVEDIGTSIFIASSSGTDSIDENTAIQLDLEKQYADGSLSNITDLATWSCDNANVHVANGNVSVGYIMSDEVATIIATYGNQAYTLEVTLRDTGFWIVSLNLSGPNALLQQSAASYFLYATYEDGSVSNVTQSALWDCDSPKATIVFGELSAGIIENDEHIALSASLQGMVATMNVWLSTVPGQIYVVDTLDDVLDEHDGQTSLREALAASNSNSAMYGLPAGSVHFPDTIIFDQSLTDGVITLSLGQLEITNSVHLIGPGSGLLTIDADQKSRVIHISGDETEVEISGLSITGGRHHLSGTVQGGGIYSDGDSLRLTDVRVADNSVSSHNYGGVALGGGVYNQRGRLLLYNSVIEDNSASSNPREHHGIYLRGGGVCHSGGLLIIEDTVVRGNRLTGYTHGYGIIAEVGGGGVYSLNNRGVMSVKNSEIYDNYASATVNNYQWNIPVYRTSSGGGVFFMGERLDAENVKVRGNSAVSCSGINASEGGPWDPVIDFISFINVEVSGNVSLEGGGYSVALRGDKMLMSHTTFAGNSGGLDITRVGSSTINNSIIALNGGVQVLGDFSGKSNIIGMDPAFEDAAGGNFELSSTSYAINLGDNTLATDAEGGLLLTDLAGNPRIANGIVDIGAYEFQGTTGSRETPSGVVTTLEDVCDPTDGLISLREAIAYAGMVESIETITFDESLSGDTFVLTNGQLEVVSSLTVDASMLDTISLNANGQSRVLNIVGHDIEVCLKGLIITGGSADNGGGILIRSGSVDLENVVVVGNSASGHGGGIYCEQGSVFLNRSEIRDNTKQGVYVRGRAEVLSSMIRDNSSHGVHVHPAGSAAIVNSECSGNGACGVYAEGELEVIQSTITNNEAYGIDNRSEDAFHLANTIAVFNGSGDVKGPYVNNNSLVSADPLFANPAFGDYRLTAPSPAVNSGSNLFAVDYDGRSLETDIEGRARINGGTVDIGAYEYFPVLSLMISGPESLDERSDGSYECTVVFEDGFSASITPIWSIDSPLADVSACGVVTVYFVQGDQTARLSAEYDAQIQGKDIVLVDTGNYLVSLALTGPDTVDQQTTNQYTLWAAYEEGTIDVTELAVWQDSIAHASIHEGQLIAGVIPVDEEVTLTAQYGGLQAQKEVFFATPPKIYIVDTLEDVRDSSDGKISLREALDAANGNVSVHGLPAGSSIYTDIIMFCETLEGGTILSALGQYIISDSVTIVGLGADRLTLDANQASRVFDISGSDVVTEISGMTITGGGGSMWPAVGGGGIHNNSEKLTLINVKVIGNSGWTSNGRGGGIYHHSGVLELLNTVISGNTIRGGGYHGSAHGGGIYINSGVMTLINSEVSGNSAMLLSRGVGAGIYNAGTAIILNTTVAGNGEHGGIYSLGALTLKNTIVALNHTYDVSGIYTGSNNIIGNDPMFVDAVNKDYRLRKESPAVDAGSNSFAVDLDGAPLEIDLAGSPRISDSFVDLGAYEYIKRPDLSIGSTDVRILDHMGIVNNNPAVGELMQVEVTVHNIGEIATVSDVFVQLFQDHVPQDLSRYDAAAFNIAASGVISNSIPIDGAATILIPWLAEGPVRMLALWPVVEFVENRSQSQVGGLLPIEELSYENNYAWRKVTVGNPEELCGFALWAQELGLSSDPAAVSGGDRIANVFKYALGENLQPGDPLMRIIMVNGESVVEVPAQILSTIPHVKISVLGSTNLVDWDESVVPVLDTAGKPEDRAWFVPEAEENKKMFFRLKSELQ